MAARGVEARRYFPFYPLGLRGNPFQALTEEEAGEAAILPRAVRQALAQGGHMQLLGPSGCGKTTLLLGLAARLRRKGRCVAYEYLPLHRRRFRTRLRDLDAFLLDEAQRLSPRERRRLLRTAQRSKRLRLFLATHEDLSPLFATFALPLTTVRLEPPTLEELAALLERRLVLFALEEGAKVEFSPSAVAFLHARYGADLRRMERFLYEVFHHLQGPTRLDAQGLLRFQEEGLERPP